MDKQSQQQLLFLPAEPAHEPTRCLKPTFTIREREETDSSSSDDESEDEAPASVSCQCHSSADISNKTDKSNFEIHYVFEKSPTANFCRSCKN